MFDIRTLLILIPALPLTAAILTALLGPRVLRRWSHLPTVIAIAGSLVLSLTLVYQVNRAQQEQHDSSASHSVGFEQVETLWTWFDVPGAYWQKPTIDADGQRIPGSLHGFHVDVSLRADALTAIMLSMVTFVSTLVAIYSIGYMQGERGYWRFFSYISLFVFSMTMLVSVSNFLLMFVFWEAVGACSYLLIGFWYQKKEAAAAGKKAFLVNRIGDFGFLLAMMLIWLNYHTLNFHDVPAVTDVATGVQTTQIDGVLGQARLEDNRFIGGGLGLAICLLLMAGACGKSAQFPLHVWLPDAMEGPTPVSALIHAATMVTAGVYMVTRCTPLFMAVPEAQVVVACIGGITALLAGLIALTQFDLKRVLAYSTISQLGYMFLALGTGSLAGISAGMFHLFTHAFFKALLFLGAGSVMHSMGGVIDMRNFSGLRRLMPITHGTFLIGCLALAGIFPLSGFWSKDAIVAAVKHKANPTAEHVATASNLPPIHLVSTSGHAVSDGSGVVIGDTHAAASYAGVYQILYYVALFTALLTAFYTFRAFFMTFYGEEQIPAEAGDHAHESPPVMWLPLAILAVCAAGIGGYFEWTHGFAHFLGTTPSLSFSSVTSTMPPGEFHLDVAVTSTVVALVGVGIAAFLYLGSSREADWLKTKLEFAKMEKSGIPALLGPYKLSLNKFYFDELYYVLFVGPLRLLGVVCYWFDRWIIDGLVNFIGRAPRHLGTLLRSLQMGMVQFYALATVLGVLTLMAVKLLWAAS